MAANHLAHLAAMNDFLKNAADLLVREPGFSHHSPPRRATMPACQPTAGHRYGDTVTAITFLLL